MNDKSHVEIDVGLTRQPNVADLACSHALKRAKPDLSSVNNSKRL